MSHVPRERSWAARLAVTLAALAIAAFALPALGGVAFLGRPVLSGVAHLTGRGLGGVAWAQEATQPPAPAEAVPATVTILASSSLRPLVDQALDGLPAATPGFVQVVSSDPSGTADIAVTKTGLPGTAGFERRAGRAVYVPVAHFACPAASIPLPLLRRAFSGRAVSWRSFGGPSRRVLPVVVAPAGRVDPFALVALGLSRVRGTRKVGTVAAALRLATTRPGVLALVPSSAANVRLRPLAVSGRQGLDPGDAGSYPVTARVVVERTHEPTPVDTSTTEPTVTAAEERELRVRAVWQRLVARLIRTAPRKNLAIVAVGDIMLSRKVLRAIYAAGDWRRPFRRTASILAAGDVTFGNLESPFSDRGGPVLAGMSFKAEPPSIAGLVTSGFDVLSLANNHFGNQGRYGMHYTFGLLDRAGIEYCGAGRDYRAAHTAAVVERRGTKVAFVSYNEIWPPDYAATAGTAGLAWMEDPRQVRRDIADARRRADVVIVSYHWGTEYTPYPTGRQRAYGRLAIDAGADAVISQHPHVVQAVEWRKGRFIAYSLGNFVFDQMWSQETREGLISHVYVTGGKISGVTLTPTVIEDYNQPRVAGRSAASRILGRVWRASGVKRW